jgi:hypothetical protein
MCTQETPRDTRVEYDIEDAGNQALIDAEKTAVVFGELHAANPLSRWGTCAVVAMAEIVSRLISLPDRRAHTYATRGDRKCSRMLTTRAAAQINLAGVASVATDE